jgi:hypothetical protein
MPSIQSKIMTKLLNKQVVRYIGKVINDYQFNKNDENYLGFINLDPLNSGDDTPYALELVENYKDYELILESVGMEFNNVPNNEEMIINEINL